MTEAKTSPAPPANERAKRQTQHDKSVRRGNLMESLDTYAGEYPLFNNKGSSKVTTSAGFAMTIVLVCLMLLYATKKLDMLLFRKNPSVSENVVESFF